MKLLFKQRFFSLFDKMCIRDRTYPVINMVPNQIITRKTLVSAAEAERLLREKELLKIAVVERHHATGCMGVGLLARYGLRDGAIATTVAHDSHNLIVVGGSDRDMHCLLYTSTASCL